MLDVKHYLGIYKLRKEAMEKGTTNPLPAGRRIINEIVSKLSRMSMDEKIDIKIKDGSYVMVDLAISYNSEMGGTKRTEVSIQLVACKLTLTFRSITSQIL